MKYPSKTQRGAVSPRARTWRRLIGGGAGLGAVALGLAFAVSPATPALAGSSNLTNGQTDKCLDGNYGGSYTLSCNGGNWQNWSWPSGGGQGSISNWQTGYCLTGNWGNPATVTTAPCNGSQAQNWAVTWSGNGYPEIVNMASGYCLDSNYHDPSAWNPDQGAAYTDPCNGGGWQVWW
jgi:serine/threonine-protein kinase